MVGRALWSVRVLLDEDLPDAGSEDTSWTTRGREDVESSRGKPSYNQAMTVLKPRHIRA